jgi:hypothetical protein
MEASSMFVYRNKNTGDVVEYPYRSNRLEMLPNWETLQEPETDSPQDPPTPTEPLAAPQEPTAPVAPEDGDKPLADPDDVERPARSAPKADWVAYARTRAQDSAEEAAIGDLTRHQLVEQYGGDS